MKRNRLWRIVGGLMLAAPLAAGAQSLPFPNKPLRIIVGYAPGGPLDSVARALAPKMSDDLKQPVVVENRPGASGVIATEAIARSAPDGHTLILNGITHAILPALNPQLPFDSLNDFTPIAIVGYGPLLLVVMFFVHLIFFHRQKAKTLEGSNSLPNPTETATQRSGS